MRGAAARGGAAGSTGGPCACGSTRWVLLRQPPGPALSVSHNPDGYNSPSSRRGATFSTSFLAAWRHDPTAPGPVGGCDRCQRACGTGIGEDRHRCRAHPAPTARSRCRGWWRPPSKQPLRDETNPSPAAPWSGAWTRSCAIASTCRRRCGGPCGPCGQRRRWKARSPDWVHVSALLGGVRALPRGSVVIKLCRLIVLASCDAACLARMSNARRSPAPPAPPPPRTPPPPDLSCGSWWQLQN